MKSRFDYLFIPCILLSVGCASTQGHHAVISKSEVQSLNRIAPISVATKVKGESCRSSVFIFGWQGGHKNPRPTVDEAIENALQSTPEANTLTHATVDLSIFYIPFIYDKYCYKVEGIPGKL